VVGSSPSKTASAAIPIPKKTSSLRAGVASSAGGSSSNTTDFRLSFSIDGKSVEAGSSIFGAVFSSESKRLGVDNPNIWAQTVTITYTKLDAGAHEKAGRAVAGAGKKSWKVKDVGGKGRVWANRLLKVGTDGVEMGKSLESAFVLLRLLYELNTRWRDFYEGEDQVQSAVAVAEGGVRAGVMVVPVAAFLNNKLSAKLKRQLDEPLIVASGVLPSWTKCVVGEFSFMVPFETRLVYLQSTSFGYSRSFLRWKQSSGSVVDSGALFGRIQRQKVRISRDKLLESMVKVMEGYGSGKSLLEIEFFGEVGTGLGPTLEFYAEVGKGVRRKGGVVFGGVNVGLWRDLDSYGGGGVLVESGNGLFPRPVKFGTNVDAERIQLLLFKCLGIFCGKSLADGRIIDFPFNSVFYELLMGNRKKGEQLRAVKVWVL
jgi:E3 ubiquitin-protein ligase TRIP12